jgi:hypothetical protein
MKKPIEETKSTPQDIISAFIAANEQVFAKIGNAAQRQEIEEFILSSYVSDVMSADTSLGNKPYLPIPQEAVVIKDWKLVEQDPDLRDNLAQSKANRLIVVLQGSLSTAAKLGMAVVVNRAEIKAPVACGKLFNMPQARHAHPDTIERLTSHWVSLLTRTPTSPSPSAAGSASSSAYALS